MLIYYLSLIEDPDDYALFERLYLTYKDIMFRKAYRILQNELDAEDAVQDAFERAVKCVKNFYGMERHTEKKYIVTIVENTAIDIYRRKRSTQNLELYDAVQSGVTDSIDDGVLAGCILALPLEYRQVILLKYDIGFSTKEIAHSLNISQALVRKREERAREMLEKLCREEGITV